ncbi:MAG: hypothetical protein QOK01_2016 [Alphaproteobacteria bacterium]|nr:hypothetical protein [Alphaproteobacteria bacterium]
MSDRKIAEAFARPKERSATLTKIRNLKMSQSAHAYVRGNTVKFYEWLAELRSGALPDGPPVWICGDCHVGNLGPVANAQGQIEIQIRDLDQTVIGNPAHDLVRLGLSLASAARGSDLSGVTTAKMLEQMMDGYEKSFEPDFHEESDVKRPDSIHLVAKRAAAASWKTLAEERIEDRRPTIPLGRRFWPISKDEKREIEELFETDDMRKLATMLRSRDDDARVKLMDAAYWRKGCSSLGRLRYAVLLRVGGKKMKKSDYCLMDLKEATQTAAPRAAGVKMPSDPAERVVEGARHLSPNLGKRMRAVRLMDKPVFVRELLPQDLKIEVEQLTRDEAMNVAGFLAAVVGKAHSRQMDSETRKKWQKDLQRNRSTALDAPTWLWTSIVELLADHERAYLEHCRKFALEVDA